MMTALKNPAWVYQGKSTGQVIKELGTFENQDLETLISIDYGDSQAPIGEIKNKDGKYLLLCYGKTASADAGAFPGMTIRQLIKELQMEEWQELEVRLSSDFDDDHKPVSRIGKKGRFCLLMSCSDFYDRKLIQ